MYNKNITFLAHLRKLKDKIYLIQKKSLEGLLEFIGDGIYVSFNFRSLPKSWNIEGGNGSKLSVTVVDCKSTTVYVKELNGSPVLNTRVLTKEDLDLLRGLYDKFKEYKDGVQYFEPDIYYLIKKENNEVNETEQFIRNAIESVNFLKTNKQ